MKSFTKDELDRALAALSEEQRNWVLSDEMARIFSEIVQEHHLTPEESELLSKGVAAALVKLVGDLEFRELVTASLGLDAKSSTGLYAALVQQILERKTVPAPTMVANASTEPSAPEAPKRNPYDGADPYHEQVG